MEFPQNSSARQAIIGLGANRGEPQEQLLEAILRLEEYADSTVQRSSFWRSEAYGMQDGSGDFVNAVVEFSTRLEPMDLLRLMQQIEVDLGRPADHARNVARPIDLDLLVYNNQKISEPDLIVPHPKMLERLFVLLPLEEILPGYQHEGVGVAELIQQAPNIDIAKLT